jgi:hypothetical protein
MGVKVKNGPLAPGIRSEPRTAATTLGTSSPTPTSRKPGTNVTILQIFSQKNNLAKNRVLIQKCSYICTFILHKNSHNFGFQEK